MFLSAACSKAGAIKYFCNISICKFSHRNEANQAYQDEYNRVFKVVSMMKLVYLYCAFMKKKLLIGCVQLIKVVDMVSYSILVFSGREYWQNNWEISFIFMKR